MFCVHVFVYTSQWHPITVYHDSLTRNSPENADKNIIQLCMQKMSVPSLWWKISL